MSGNTPYTARGPHKRPCDCCGLPILPGDACSRWMWVSPEGPAYSNIMRVHAPCGDLAGELMLCGWTLGEAFLDEYTLSTGPLQLQAMGRVALMRDAARAPLEVATP